jgi:hypothetical protein
MGNGTIKEYLIKGFAMNDELLKEAGGGNYFDELLATSVIFVHLKKCFGVRF